MRKNWPKVCRVKGHNVTIARAAAKPGDEASVVGFLYIQENTQAA